MAITGFTFFQTGINKIFYFHGEISLPLAQTFYVK